MDLTAILVAIIAGLVGIVSATVSARQAWHARRANRTDQVEARLDKSEKDNQLLYLWNRQLVDHIYRGCPPPPPAPPAGLFS